MPGSYVYRKRISVRDIGASPVKLRLFLLGFFTSRKRLRRDNDGKTNKNPQKRSFKNRKTSFRVECEALRLPVLVVPPVAPHSWTPKSGAAPTDVHPTSLPLSMRGLPAASAGPMQPVSDVLAKSAFASVIDESQVFDAVLPPEEWLA